MARWYIALGLLATIGSLAVAKTQTARFSHSGQLIDAADGHEIFGAQAQAWRAEIPNATGACPAHTEPLSNQQTDGQGRFQFVIDAKYPDYFTQYCATGYATNQQPGNDNTRSGAVNPDPVQLINPNATSNDVYNASEGVLSQAGSDFRQLARKDPNGFSSAQESLPAQDRNAVMVLINRATSRAPRGSVPQDPRAGINWILNDAASNLRYFSGAVRDGFPPALRRFPDPERVVIEWLIKRPRSVAR